jgi:hypothetical protein
MQCEKTIPVWLLNNALELWRVTDKLRDSAYNDLYRIFLFSNAIWAMVCGYLIWMM